MRRLSSNRLGDDGTGAICKALSKSKVSKLQELDLQDNGVGQSGAKAIGDMILVQAELTKCKLRGNKLGVEGWTIIFNALRDSPTSKIAEWDLFDENLGPAIAKPLAEYLSVTAELTKLGCACPKSNLRM